MKSQRSKYGSLSLGQFLRHKIMVENASVETAVATAMPLYSTDRRTVERIARGLDIERQSPSEPRLDMAGDTMPEMK